MVWEEGGGGKSNYPGGEHFFTHRGEEQLPRVGSHIHTHRGGRPEPWTGYFPPFPPYKYSPVHRDIEMLNITEILNTYAELCSKTELRAPDPSLQVFEGLPGDANSSPYFR